MALDIEGSNPSSHPNTKEVYMEDKIEVNEYVRTKNGEIHKVIEIKKNRYITNFDDYFYYRYDNNMGGFKSDIAKHSKQLIDLIEVGDYVNGIRILDITGDYVLTAEYNCCKQRLNNKIQTILTKESYMVNCYKVGGEEDEASND